MLKYDTENYFQQFTNFLSEKFILPEREHTDLLM